MFFRMLGQIHWRISCVNSEGNVEMLLDLPTAYEQKSTEHKYHELFENLMLSCRLSLLDVFLEMRFGASVI